MSLKYYERPPWGVSVKSPPHRPLPRGRSFSNAPGSVECGPLVLPAVAIASACAEPSCVRSARSGRGRRTESPAREGDRLRLRLRPPAPVMRAMAPAAAGAHDVGMALRKAEEAGESTHSAPRPRSRVRMAECGGVGVRVPFAFALVLLFCLVVSCVRPGGRSALAALATACFFVLRWWRAELRRRRMWRNLVTAFPRLRLASGLVLHGSVITVGLLIVRLCN